MITATCFTCLILDIVQECFLVTLERRSLQNKVNDGKAPLSFGLLYLLCINFSRVKVGDGAVHMSMNLHESVHCSWRASI